MTSFLRLVDDHPVRVSIVLTAVLASIELTLLTIPFPLGGWFVVAGWLPWVGALLGGLVVRSWWWLLIYPLGCLIGFMLLAARGLRQGDTASLSAGGDGVVGLAALVLPLVLVLAAIGPFYASLHRRFGRRRPASPPSDQGAA